MTFLDHLEELRGTIFKSLVAFITASVLIVVFLSKVASLLMWPLNFALGDDKSMVGEGLVTTSPMSIFVVIFQITFLGGLALALPFILYFVARFIAPGLTRREVALLRPVCVAALLLFLFGAAFAFVILCPATLKASLYFNEMFQFKILWSADRYYGMLTWMTMGVGILFEFPLLILAGIAVGIIDTARLRLYRSHSIVGFLILAAIVTPSGDPITFLLLAVPMMILYEIAILIGVRIERRRIEREEEEEFA